MNKPLTLRHGASLVAVAMLMLVDKLTTEDAAPTRRMSRIGAQANFGGTSDGLSTPRPDQM